MIALIMAGGVGTRFWPMSRKANPKQFLNIVGAKSMIRLTAERLSSKIDFKDIFVVTAASQADLTRKHLPELPEENIIIEPFGMNTAPCIALSAFYLNRKYDANEKILVLPADHLIAKTDEFLHKLDLAETAAGEDNLVTFGIEPDYPATGYGYIEGGNLQNEGIFNVKQFKEKPDLATAQQFLEKGNFYWNSGMFMWKISTIMDAYKNFLPKVSNVMHEINKIWDDLGLQADISEAYGKMPKIPVDIGIMEQAEKRSVIPVNIGWSDVGSWKALYDVSVKDANKTVIPKNNIQIESSNNYINSDKFVALIGVENLVVVETKDAILIANKDRSETVKNVVNKLDELGKEELL